MKTHFVSSLVFIIIAGCASPPKHLIPERISTIKKVALELGVGN